MRPLLASTNTLRATIDTKLFATIPHEKELNSKMCRPSSKKVTSPRTEKKQPVAGMPLESRKDWTLDTDPRTWPVFERVTLEDGVLLPDKLVARGKKRSGKYLRPPSEYLGKIPSEKYEVEAGRYHLFVSGICPWASSVVTARHLLGLQDVISMDIADGQSGAGWTFLDGASVGPWKDRPGPFWLHEAYQLDNSRVTTRITVPVLWDTKTNTIVSDDSWTIVKVMSTAFSGMGMPSAAAAARMSIDSSGYPTLTPPDLNFAMEKSHSDIYDALLNGVYKAGLGLFTNGYEETDAVSAAREGVYDKLSELNLKLSKQRFLLGDKMTAPDIRLAMTIFRWDCSYRDAFVLKGGRGGIRLGNGYPHLKAYLRDLYVVMEPVIDFVAMRQYYRIRQGVNKAFIRSQGKTYVEEKKEELCPLPDLRPIIAAAKEPAGRHPSLPFFNVFIHV